MKTGYLLLVACCWLAISNFCFAGTWESLDYPGAAWTEAYGISGSSVVGVYGTGTGPYDGQGFLLNGINYTALNYPGAISTRAYGISDSNIVGEYFDSSHNEHGFVYNKTSNSWTPLNYSGANSTACTGISGSKIVGVYSDASGGHSFIYDLKGNSWTTLDYPGAVSTSAFGIYYFSSFGHSFLRVVGYYYDSSYNKNNFVYDGTNWTTLPPPADAYSTEARGISGSAIVGYYSDYYGEFGFQYAGNTWTILEYPGAWMTFAEDVSSSKIVGRYYDNSAGGTHYEHGFIYSTYAEGDFDRDMRVNFRDFRFFKDQYLQIPDIPSADIAPRGGDGKVDLKDFAILAKDWTGD